KTCVKPAQIVRLYPDAPLTVGQPVAQLRVIGGKRARITVDQVRVCHGCRHRGPRQYRDSKGNSPKSRSAHATTSALGPRSTECTGLTTTIGFGARETPCS